jgi:hypothetical protein
LRYGGETWIETGGVVDRRHVTVRPLDHRPAFLRHLQVRGCYPMTSQEQGP